MMDWPLISSKWVRKSAATGGDGNDMVSRG